ncbi:MULTISPECIES: hypothetical protein [unclassified Mesorhizobium]|uniref:hypothetical protein n=1 Tax=unclassified Mesorhizobium TaxID=325217 RepID=UPI001CCFCF2F|nr:MULTISPECIES: hypothetical protein [unclassified Mesorhizobium]MBZ9802623.1 hypothetical protein [Mesorhizobium sp. ES1-6]
MRLAAQAASVITEIEHQHARAAPGGARATTALRNSQPFQHNQEKTQEGNDQ